MFFSALIQISIFALLIPFSAQALAAKTFDKAGFHITVEPIVGYEFTQVTNPTIHTRGMVVYGARVTAGHKLISGEGEYTQGTTNETFPTQDKNIKTDKQNVRLGIRSALTLNAFSDFIFRAGGQATKSKVDTTTISTVTTLTNSGKWDIRPYAGTGLQIHFHQMVSLGMEVTYVFRSVTDWSQNDVQPAVSLKINLPTK